MKGGKGAGIHGLEHATVIALRVAPEPAGVKFLEKE